jgi:histidinol phosphatase-like PHP family hydrolase
MRLSHDLHVHTYISACCSEKKRHIPSAILALAEQMGISTIGFADHVWVNPDLKPSNWYRPQDESQITRLRADLKTVSTRLRVLVGCEAEMIAPGKFGITRAFAETLDFVLLACSHFHMTDFVAQPPSATPAALAKHMLEFFRSAVSSGLATSIPHPLLPCGHMDQFDAAIAALSDAELQDAVGLAAERGVALEITTGFIPKADSKFSIETPIRFLALAKRAGCKFTFGSDAHTPEVQKRLPELMEIVQALGLTEEDLLPLVRT